MSADADRLRRLLGGDDLSWLVDRVRSRLASGAALTGAVTLPGASDAQRLAVARLLGRPVGRGTSVSVSLEALSEVVRRGGMAPDVGAAVVALSGPIAIRRELRETEAAAWAAALAPVTALVRGRPELTAWADRLDATGLLRRVARGSTNRARVLAEQAVAVLMRLPAAGVPLSVLASTTADDGHALDADRPLSSLVLPAAALLGGVGPGEGAEWRRTVWASVGVLSGELTGPVLTLNLPGDAGTTTGRALAVWRDAGQPVHLTTRQLVRHPPELRLSGRTVFVCENPTVVAEAANRLGREAAPVVCTSGHPAAAATSLLRALARAGAVLRYHGDFDWSGVTIANGIVTRFGALPWRFDAASYRAAVEAGRGGAALHGGPVAATWDATLGAAMAELGVRVEEESVMDDLLTDLAAAAEPTG